VSEPNDLGTVVCEFRPRRWGTGLVVFGLAMALSIGFALLRNPVDRKKDGPVAAAAFVGFLCLVGSQVCYLQWAFSRGQQIVIHEHGLVTRNPQYDVLTWNPGKAQQVRWEDVGVVYHDLSSPYELNNGQEVWLVTRGGETVELPRGVARLFAAYCAICDGIKAQLLQELRQKIAAGRAVTFGDDLRVGRDGLRWRGRLLPMADVKKLHWGVERTPPSERQREFRVRTVQSFFGVLEPAGYERLPTKSIPNLPILLEMLETDHHVAVERETGSCW
jgi:hypothetical protein